MFEYYRFVILLIGLGCLTSLCGNCMIHHFTRTCFENNSTLSTLESTIIDFGASIGAISGFLPFHILFTKYDPKVTFFVAGMISSISTALIPLATPLLLGIIKIIQGFAYSSSFGVIGHLVVKWPPVSELTIFLGVLTCFPGIVIFVNSILERFYICALIHDVYAVFGMVVFVCWVVFYKDNRSEKNKTSIKIVTPYLKILTSSKILITWLNAYTSVTLLSFSILYLPTYFEKILNIDAATLLTISVGITIPSRILAALFSDKMTIFGEKKTIVFFNLMSVGFASWFFGLIWFFENQVVVFILFILASILSSWNCAGYYKSAALHSRQHSPFVISIMQLLGTFSIITSSVIHDTFVTDQQDRTIWRSPFLILTFSNILAATLSFFVMTDEPAEWTIIKKPSPHIDFSKFEKL